MLLLYILIAAAIIAAGVIFTLTKLGKIADSDGDGIPDTVEEKIEDVNEQFLKPRKFELKWAIPTVLRNP